MSRKKKSVLFIKLLTPSNTRAVAIACPSRLIAYRLEAKRPLSSTNTVSALRASVRKDNSPTGYL